MTRLGGVVVLTGTAVEHRYVTRILAAGLDVAAVVTDLGARRGRLDRLARARRRFGTRGLLERSALRAVLRASGESGRRNRALIDVLGDPAFPAGVPTFTTFGVNDAATRRLLHELSPDVLCVYGTSIVGRDTLASARRIALNLHTGISPRYRGADCTFWPLYNGEPQWLGATVHECTADVDGGAVYGTARARLEASDGVAEVFGRCVVAGADLYAHVTADALAGTAAATPQDLRQGTDYRVAARDWRAELVVRRALRDGLVRDYVAAGQPSAWEATRS